MCDAQCHQIARQGTDQTRAQGAHVSDTNLPDSPRKCPLFGPLPARVHLKLPPVSTIAAFTWCHPPPRGCPRRTRRGLARLRRIERGELTSTAVKPQSIAESDLVWLRVPLPLVTVWTETSSTETSVRIRSSACGDRREGAIVGGGYSPRPRGTKPTSCGGGPLFRCGRRTPHRARPNRRSGW